MNNCETCGAYMECIIGNFYLCPAKCDTVVKTSPRTGDYMSLEIEIDAGASGWHGQSTMYRWDWFERGKSKATYGAQDKAIIIGKEFEFFQNEYGRYSIDPAKAIYLVYEGCHCDACGKAWEAVQ